MPIPHLEQKRKKHGNHARSASEIRKERAAKRQGSSTAGGFKKTPIADAPATGKTKKKSSKKKNTPKGPLTLKKLWSYKLFRWAVYAIIALGLLGVIGIAAAFAWVSQDLADITDIEKRAITQSTTLYARDGETVLYQIGDNRRQDVNLDQINPYILQATVALEDRRFYDHAGYDPIGIMRAGFQFLLNRDISSAQGASTLTQQFARNAILTQDRNITRKLKEIILAVRIENKYDKDEILNLYLNEVYFGPNYQGVEVAAQEYFDTSAAEVTLDQAATLASLPKNPVSYPRNPERLKQRRDFALDVMAELGNITEEEAEAAKAVELGVLDDGITEINAPHFTFYVTEILEEQFGQNTLRKGGLKVTTSLDWDKQQQAEEAIDAGIPRIEQYGGSNAALVSLDAHTGQILAMVGSRDYFDSERDGQVNVATSLRQPGSSFKPIVYLAGFMNDYTPDTKLWDVETDFITEAEGKYHPRNYDLGQRGAVTLRESLGQSLNITAVKLLYLVGVDKAIDIAESLGYTSFADRSRFGLALVLGGAEVSLLEHTSTFATFAREGERRPPAAILKIEDRDGNVLEEWQDEPQQVVDKDAARTLNSVLSDPGARAGFGALNLRDRPVASKTGTTNDYRDAWTMGYTPSMATGVWVGNNDNSEMARGAAGLIVAAPIWNDYMNRVLGGTPVETFQAASYTAKNEALGGKVEETIEKQVDSITGELIPDECVESYPEEFQQTKEFKEGHTILHYITKEEPGGGVPENPRQDPMYEAWETGVQLFLNAEERRTEYLGDETPRVDCNFRNKKSQPEVTISSLEEGEEYIPSTMRIRAAVEPGNGRTIQTIEFIVDDAVTVETLRDQNITESTSVSSSYRPRQTLTGGRHSVTVRVTDDVGNTATDVVNIVYNP